MAYYATYDFPDHKKGDTFLGVIFIMKDKNGDPIDIDGATIELKTFGPAETKLTTADSGGITILDESSEDGGRFQIDSQIIDWAVGSYVYEIMITFQSGRIRTYIKGRWNIIK